MSLRILYKPTKQELELSASEMGLALPSAETREEIEDTSRFQSLGDTHIFTFDVPFNLADPIIEVGKVTLAISKECALIFSTFDSPGMRAALSRLEPSFGISTTFRVLVATLVDRLADGIEKISQQANKLSSQLFAGAKLKSPNARESHYSDLVTGLARSIEHTAAFRQALMTFRRGLLYTKEFDIELIDQSTFKAILRDIDSLNEHCTFITTRLNYLQDSVFGLLSVEQNKIIKIFTIAAVIFLPPTMFASIWGMNFDFMPELDEVWGYPLAITTMILSGYIPWRIFKAKGWM